MDEQTRRIQFIEIKLLNEILESQLEFHSQTCISRSAKLLTQYDGFMSSIYLLTFSLRGVSSDRARDYAIMVKLMKGSEEFRRISRAVVQFSNEIAVYSKVIPTLKKFLQSEQYSSLNPDDWIPKVYYADYGLYHDLSDGLESILATQNMTVEEYCTASTIDLDESHLRMMINTLAEFHAVQYAFKIKCHNRFCELRNNITPFSYIDPDNDKNVFAVLYKIAIDRFLYFYDRTNADKGTKFDSDVETLRNRFSGAPLKLMSKFEHDDVVYNVIVHGDYNRNNMLFKYNNQNNPVSMKMLDFQLTRYASPACDLTFFMYFNMNPNLHDLLWESLLDQYHTTMIRIVANILRVNQSDQILDAYSKDNFLKNFAKFAFSGVMTAMQFLPWVMCSEQHAKKISELFVNDMQSKDFYDFAMIMGGDAPKERIMKIFQHASRMGYTAILQE